MTSWWRRRLVVALPLAVAVTAACAVVSLRARRIAIAAPPVASFVVPRADGAMDIDGELEEPEWLRRAARSGAFMNAEGGPAIPFSEARLLWGSDRLRIALYAADIDIRTRSGDVDADTFDVRFRRDGRLYRLEVGPDGPLHGWTCASPDWECRGDHATWSPALRIGRDVDGTPDAPRDDDEEWVLEMELPLAAIGVPPQAGERFAMRVSRCDVPRGAARACGAWSGGRASDLVLGAP